MGPKGESSGASPAVDGVDRHRASWRRIPGAIAVPSARNRQSSTRRPRRDRPAARSLSSMISGRGRDGQADRRPSSRTSHKKVPAWRRGTMKVSLPPAAMRRVGVSGSALPAPSSPQIERNRRWEVVAQDRMSTRSPPLFEAAASPGLSPRSDATCVGGRPGSRRDGICRGAQVDGLAPLGGCNAMKPGRGDCGEPRHHLPAVPNWFRPRCSNRPLPHRSGPFSGCSVQPSHYGADIRAQNRPFFCCEPAGSCYKPRRAGHVHDLVPLIMNMCSNNLEHDGREKTAAHFSASCSGIADGLYAISGRGGTGRRAGFRFQ